jgi:hypothetical protein
MPQSIRVMRPRRHGSFLVCLPVVLLLSACSTGREAATAPRLILDRQTVAIMTAANAEEADRLRLSLLRGQPPPSSAQLISIDELNRSNPTLGNVAAQLADCEISPPLPPTDTQTSSGYLVLQRGGDPEQPCHGSVIAADQESWTDKAGELLVGVLVIGMVGFLAAAPFIFHIF